MHKQRIKGVYAIADSAVIGDEAFAKSVRAVINNGASVIQYRAKLANRATRLRQSTLLAELCDQANIPLIINDDLELCQRINAAGIHIGQNDCDLASARRQLGADKIIGVSCYDDLSRALAAQQSGASYVAFGALFPSATKPDAVTAPLALLREAKQSLTIPIVAIGGITMANVQQVIDTGVDAVAVIRGIFATPNPGDITKNMTELFGEYHA